VHYRCAGARIRSSLPALRSLTALHSTGDSRHALA
jgi:hypothetical protein